MAVAETARLFAELALRDKLSPGLKTATSNLGKTESAFSRVSRGAGQVTTGLAKAGTRIALIGAGVGVATGKLSADFESAFAGIRKTVDETELTAVGLSFDKLRTQILDMSTQIPVAATALSDIGAEAGALGIRAQDITRFTEVVAKLGVTTNLSTDEASTALGHLGTILHLTGDDFERVADTIVNLGNRGASTESEIVGVAERLASAGRQAGLTNDQILGLSSTLASLRAAGGVEAAGSSVSRLLQKMATNIALLNPEGTALAKTLGLTGKQAQRMVNKGQGLPLLVGLLEKLRVAKPTRQAKILDALGINNVRDLDTIRKLSQQLPELKRQLDVASESTGALDKEAQTRFDTLNSKLTLLKNNLVRLGIEVGDGFTPAVGRAAEKLRTLLADPEFLKKARDIGKQIGEAIDSIDWKQVVEAAKGFADALKPALTVAQNIFSVLNSLPAEVKGAGLGFLALDKLSGGLIGAGVENIAGGLLGGLGRGALGRLPGVGALTATPVRVVNWPVGGLGGTGGAGAAGGGRVAGAATKALSIASIVTSAVAVWETQQQVSGQSSQMGRDLQDTLSRDITVKTDPELATALAGVNQGIRDLTSNPLNVLVQGSALDSLKAMAAQIEGEQQKRNAVGFRADERASETKSDWSKRTPDEIAKTRQDLATKQEQAKAAISESMDRNKLATVASLTTLDSTTRSGTTSMTSAQREAGASVVAAMNNAASRMVAAIYGARPVIQSTNVTRNTTVIQRAGPTGGSGNTQRVGRGGLIPG